MSYYSYRFTKLGDWGITSKIEDEFSAIFPNDGTYVLCHTNAQ